MLLAAEKKKKQQGCVAASLLVLTRPSPRRVLANKLLPGFERRHAAVQGPTAAGRRIQQLLRVLAEEAGAAVRPVPAAQLRRHREPAAEAAVKYVKQHRLPH